MRIRVLLLLCLLVFSLPAQASHGPPAPDELGPWAVGRTPFGVVDPARADRPLLVDVWYPVDPADAVGDPSTYQVLFIFLDSEVALDNPPVADRHFPLVLFSHGNGGLRFQSFFLTEALASHGFVVVAPDHTDNTLIDFLFGDPTDESTLQSALDRPQDLSFLIDVMLSRSSDPSDPFFETIDSRRIGVTGHSFGGFTSLAMVSGITGAIAEQFGLEIPDDFEPIPPDPRVRAIAPIAPASTPLADSELETIDVPTLVLGGTADVTTPLDPEVTRPFELISGRPLYRADILDAGHFSFTSLCDLIQALLDLGIPPELVEDLVGDALEEGCVPALIPIEEAHRLTNLYAVSFLRRHVAGDLRYARFLTRRHARAFEPDVEFFVKRRPFPPLALFFLLLLRWLFGGGLV